MADLKKDDIINIREIILAEQIKEVCSELRLIDAINLIVLIKTDQHANIEDLIASSCELYFKPNTLKYGFASEAHLNWGGIPSVAFDMEFQNNGVTVFFSLLLGSLKAGVDIHQIIFENPSEKQEENNEQLKNALADARIKRG